ncbi:peroxidase E5 [Manihot esculenta]|uniref:Peroxidase n=1 Tax=Manihot esculenta TaxID=3983 RepID=A0A2C9UFN4_MANES|nr:peroxidase E5 [Manihot esculenta]OAY28915.1 hypothetical protein MANES_15G104100v8 [Manihot esculenta]
MRKTMHSSPSMLVLIALCAILIESSGGLAQAKLSPTFYDQSCPFVSHIIREVIADALQTDKRIGASLIRLHFHDCFVQGCDASVLLDNSDTILSEKEALPNNNSLRGFDVVDKMKAWLEFACPGVVSCADILTIAAQESVALSGGPIWRNQLGRRDSRTANRSLANTNLPGPFLPLQGLKSAFTAIGLNNHTDLVALSGAHTFGRAQCGGFIHRLYNFNNTGRPDPTLNPTYLRILRKICPQGGNTTVLANFDPTTPDTFDNDYYSNLLVGKGLLQTDQELFSTPGADTAKIVKKFSANQTAFFESFVVSMLRMGNLKVLTGTAGEIRLNCRKVNGDSSGGADTLLVSSM